MYGVPHIILTVESARFVYIHYITNYYETVQFKQSPTDCLLVFSERELAFTFASPVRLSVVCLPVTFVHPTQAIEILGFPAIWYAGYLLTSR